MIYFLDTNVIIDALHGKYPSIINHFKKHSPSEIFIPSIVCAELEYGARHSGNYLQNKNLYETFIQPYKTVSFSKEMSEIYGAIRNDLTKTGKTIGPNDLIIAATVLHENGILVTHNTNEFSRVNGLNLQDWTV